VWENKKFNGAMHSEAENAQNMSMHEQIEKLRFGFPYKSLLSLRAFFVTIRAA